MFVLRWLPACLAIYSLASGKKWPPRPPPVSGVNQQAPGPESGRREPSPAAQRGARLDHRGRSSELTGPQTGNSPEHTDRVATDQPERRLHPHFTQHQRAGHSASPAQMPHCSAARNNSSDVPAPRLPRSRSEPPVGAADGPVSHAAYEYKTAC